MRSLALLAAFCAPVLAQSSRTACSLAPEIEKEYLALPSMSDLSRSWEERYAPRRDLAKKHPSDWPLQFALQEPILHHFDMGREWDLAIARYRALPDHLLGELLEARLVSSLHRKKSREALDHVLGRAADSPWSHLAALEWAADRMNGDPALAAQEFEEFSRRCPGNLLAFRHLGSVRDAQKLRGHVVELRNAIEAEKKRGLGEDRLELLRTAWTWERITYGDDRLEGFRRAVRADLDFLREHPNYASSAWVYMVSYGHREILKESAAVKAIEDETLRRAPNGDAAYWIEQERWREQNPQPQQSPPDPNQPIPPSEVAAQEAYSARYTAFRLVLIERFWGKSYAGFDAAELLQAQSLPDGARERLADFVLSNAERFPDQGASWPPVQIQVAQSYVDHKIRLDRVPTLVQQGLEQVEYQEKYRSDSDAFEKMPTRRGENNITFAQRRAREILIQHAIVTQQKERALALLSDFRRELDESKPADTTGRAGSSWRRDQMSYWMLARQAGLNVPIPDLSTPKVEEAERYSVADFEAKDLSGRIWRLSDLKGKVTYVNIWATWCGPCRAEMPGIKKLYERWKDRSDRVILTISVDSNAKFAENFIRENHYSFPAIYGQEIAEKFFPASGFPQNWLIDPQGRRLDRRAPRASETTIPRIEEMVDQIAAKQ